MNINLEKDIVSVIAPMCKNDGVEVVDINFKQQGARLNIQVLVDTPDGITLKHCARLNRVIGDRVDKLESMSNVSYIIEVSSPGLDRHLKTERDFEKVIGKDIHIITNKPVENRNDWIGMLKSVNDNGIEIAVNLKNEQKIITVLRQDIVRAQQHIG
ncbi:hypothetical protein B9J78_00950 [bacterium Unc6]|nr:hypothetical protein [bacterium Unc6]